MSNEKTKLSEERAREVITEFYDLGEIHSVTPLESGHQSDNAKILTTKGVYVLKLLSGVHAEHQEDKMNLLELLHTYGVKIPIPIKTKANNYVVSIDLNKFVVNSFIPGEAIYREDQSKMYNWMKWFGKQFGIFHKKSSQIPLEEINNKVKNNIFYDLSPPPSEWVMERYRESDIILPQHEKNKTILEYFKKFKEKSQKMVFSNLSRGIIHGDNMPGNFLKIKKELTGIIDFGSIGYYYLMADLGTWVMYTKLYDPVMKERFKDFIIPYLEFSEIPCDEIKLLPTFFRARTFVQYFYYAWRIYNNVTQGSEEEDTEEEVREYNWKGFTRGISLVEIGNSIDDNYFYDLSIE